MTKDEYILFLLYRLLMLVLNKEFLYCIVVYWGKGDIFISNSLKNRRFTVDTSRLPTESSGGKHIGRIDLLTFPIIAQCELTALVKSQVFCTVYYVLVRNKELWCCICCVYSKKYLKSNALKLNFLKKDHYFLKQSYCTKAYLDELLRFTINYSMN